MIAQWKPIPGFPAKRFRAAQWLETPQNASICRSKNKTRVGIEMPTLVDAP
jgi:hypothetical protein